MPSVFVYVVDRDFGFAPNPFHGYCTLATCKPGIRNSAQIGDWVVGMGGSRLNATARCIFAMQVTAKITFDEYWSNPIYNEKKPVRNGSRKMMVGDNIYHRDSGDLRWRQADSHHSNPDGTVNIHNMERDTRVDQVLISNRFFYFGTAAPVVPQPILDQLNYKNPRSYRRFENHVGVPLIDWVEANFSKSINELVGDPFEFSQSGKRYSGKGSKII